MPQKSPNTFFHQKLTIYESNQCMNRIYSNTEASISALLNGINRTVADWNAVSAAHNHSRRLELKATFDADRATFSLRMRFPNPSPPVPGTRRRKIPYVNYSHEALMDQANEWTPLLMETARSLANHIHQNVNALLKVIEVLNILNHPGQYIKQHRPASISTLQE